MLCLCLENVLYVCELRPSSCSLRLCSSLSARLTTDSYNRRRLLNTQLTAHFTGQGVL